MKAVKINRKLRDELKEYSPEPMGYDAIIMRLIHEVSDMMPIIDNDNKPININLHEDTMEMLKSYRLSQGESYENIITRMLILSKDLNNNID